MLSKLIGGVVPSKDGIFDSTDKSTNSFGIYERTEGKKSLSKTSPDSRNISSTLNKEILKSTNITPSPVPLHNSMAGIGSRIESLVSGGLGPLGGGGLSRATGLSLGRHQV